MADPEPFGGSFLEDLKGWVKLLDTNTKSTWDLVEMLENWSVHVRMVVIHQGNCNGVWHATSAWIYGIICVFFAILLSINGRYRRRRRVHMMCSRAPCCFAETYLTISYGWRFWWTMHFIILFHKSTNTLAPFKHTSYSQTVWQWDPTATVKLGIFFSIIWFIVQCTEPIVG